MARWIKDVTKDRALLVAPDSSGFIRVFIVLTITMACSGFVYTGLTNTMPKLMEMGLSAVMASSYTEIGIFVGVISGIASVSSVFGGWMADRYSARAIYIVFWTLQIPLLFITVSLSDYTLLAAILLILSFILAFSAAENMLVAHYTPFRWRAVVALGVGGLTVHLAGWLFDQDGDFSTLFAFFGSAAIMAGTAAILLPSAAPQTAVAADGQND